MHELNSILICAEVTGCFKERKRKRSRWAETQWNQGGEELWKKGVGPCDTQVGLLRGTACIRFLPSHRAWGQRPDLQVWAEQIADSSGSLEFSLDKCCEGKIWKNVKVAKQVDLECSYPKKEIILMYHDGATMELPLSCGNQIAIWKCIKSAPTLIQCQVYLNKNKGASSYNINTSLKAAYVDGHRDELRMS